MSEPSPSDEAEDTGWTWYVIIGAGFFAGMMCAAFVGAEGHWYEFLVVGLVAGTVWALGFRLLRRVRERLRIR